MNKNDRNQLAEIESKLEDIKTLLEDLQCAEQDKFNNLTEGLQASERGQNYENAANALQESVDSIESAINSIQEATEF